MSRIACGVDAAKRKTDNKPKMLVKHPVPI